MHVLRVVVVSSVLAALSGCPSCAPDLVGQGVARLTVRNVGAMVSLVNNDADCGFDSPEVLAAAVADGEIGGAGTLTFKVDGCTIDAGAGTDVSEDCQGVKTKAKGQFTITATRTITGTLTGDAENPIVPGSADAVSIKISKVETKDFSVENSESSDVLTMVSGSLSVASFKPRLGVDETSGACAIPTPVVTVKDIAYKDAVVHVKTDDNDFDADVATSKFSAQNGKKGGEENSITGTMTVFGSEIEVDGDGKLDPDYALKDFEDSYSCTDNLAAPDAFTCGSLDELVANGAARLSVKALGTIVAILDADEACGFSSDGVLGAGAPSGVVGADGSITFTVTDCTLNFGSTDVALDEDCNGNATVVSGSVVVSGAKVVQGRFTGNPATPVVPDDDSPATFTITAVATNFAVGSTGSENRITFENGTIGGVVTPRTALSGDTGACSIATPNATLSDIEVVNADVLVRSSSGTFSLHVDHAGLEATNGVVGSNENSLSGEVMVGEETFTVPADGAGLDPAYDADAFIDSFVCDPELVPGPVYDCQFAIPIGVGAAQLTMRTIGTVAKMLESTAVAPCGFGSAAVAGTPVFTGTGGVGNDGQTATFTIGTACDVAVPADTALGLDCAGTITTAGGAFSATGTKAVIGYQTGNPYNPVVPTSRDPAEVTLSITFDNFVVENSLSTSSLLIKSGTLTGTVAPRTALDRTTGACSISTPNVAFSNVVWTDADVTLVSNGSTFDFTIDSASLTAQNGTTESASNALSGTITVDGAPVSIATGTPLDPEFDQTLFDASYTCDPDGDVGPLPAPILAANDAMCSFRQVLGEAAARLITKNVGVATSVFDGNPVCGFEAPAVVGAGVQVGTPGGPGTFTLTTADCPTPLGDTPVQLSTTCEIQPGVTLETLASGTVTGSGTKVISGVLTGQAIPNNIIPATREAVVLSPSLTFSAFELFDRVIGTEEDTRSTLTGTVSAVVTPVLGQSIATTSAAGFPAYTHNVPVATIADITMADGAMTIYSDGNTFLLTLADVALEAFNGSYSEPGPDGRENVISGDLTVDGFPVTIAAGSPLDPEFNLAAFTASYACTPDLTAPIPSAP